MPDAGLGTTRTFLPTSVVPRKPRPRISDIKKVVSDANGITVADIESASREVRFARPRMVAYALCREMTHASLPAIARQFGGRDHTTVLSGARRIAGIVQTDPVLGKAMDDYRAQINQIVAERAPPIEPPPPPPRTDMRGDLSNLDERPWTDNEIIILTSCYKLGIRTKLIAGELKRSPAAVRSKAHKLGFGGHDAIPRVHGEVAHMLELSA